MKISAISVAPAYGGVNVIGERKKTAVIRNGEPASAKAKGALAAGGYAASAAALGVAGWRRKIQHRHHSSVKPLKAAR
jgi:hypothetical protein